MAWAGVCFALLSIMYFLNWAGPLGKMRSGGRWFWAWPVFWPYFLLSEISFYLARKAGKIHPHSEIAPGLFLGRKLSEEEASTLIQNTGIRGVVDVAVEFSETPMFREAEYLSIPVLDAMPPRVGVLKQAVVWIERIHKTGPVYLHCALGHGRSATVAAAYLIHAGIAKDANDAIRKIRAARQGIKLNESQRESVMAIRRGG